MLREQVLRYRLHLRVVNHLTAYSCRAKTASLNTRRFYFSPVKIPEYSGTMVELPGTAPGSDESITRNHLSP
jgi:hypothetical protein